MPVSGAFLRRGSFLFTADGYVYFRHSFGEATANRSLPPTAAEASPPQRMCPHVYLSVHVYVAATRCELSRSVVFSSRALHMPRGACACVHRFGTLPPVSCQHLPSVVVRPSAVRPPSVRRGDVEVCEEWKYFFWLTPHRSAHRCATALPSGAPLPVHVPSFHAFFLLGGWSHTNLCAEPWHMMRLGLHSTERKAPVIDVF